MLGSTESEHRSLVRHEVIIEYVTMIPQRHRRTTARNNTALCTVKSQSVVCLFLVTRTAYTFLNLSPKSICECLRNSVQFKPRNTQKEINHTITLLIMRSKVQTKRGQEKTEL